MAKYMKSVFSETKNLNPIVTVREWALYNIIYTRVRNTTSLFHDVQKLIVSILNEIDTCHVQNVHGFISFLSPRQRSCEGI